MGEPKMPTMEELKKMQEEAEKQSGNDKGYIPRVTPEEEAHYNENVDLETGEEHLPEE